MLILWTLFTFIQAQSAKLAIGILESEYTDTKFITSFESSIEGLLSSIESSLELPFDILLIPEKIKLSSFNGIWAVPFRFSQYDISIFIDSTNHPIFSQYLAGQAISNNWLHIVIGRPFNSIVGEVSNLNTFYTYPNYREEVLALYEIVQKYEWENLGLIYDEQVNNIQMANMFKSMVPESNIKDELILDSNDAMSYISLSNRLDSTTRNSGARIILVFSNPVLAGLLLRSADEVVMGSSGFAWIFNSEAMYNLGQIAKNSHVDIPSESYGVLKTGAIGIMAEDQEYLNKESTAEIYSVIASIAAGYKKTGSVSEIRDYLTENHDLNILPFPLHFDSMRIKKVKYSMYNIKNFASRAVASWDSANRVFIFDPNIEITWPGLSTKSPDDNVPILKVCLLYPKTNSDGSLNPKGEEIKRGFDMSIKEINANRDILGDYNIEIIYKDTLLSVSLASVTVKSLASLNLLGYIGPDSDELSKAYANALGVYLDPKPVVSYLASDYLLTDSTVYPRFLRMVQPDGLEAVAIAMKINTLTWKKVAVIYSDDFTGRGIYVSFASNMNTLEIEIVNDLNKRSIVVDTNSDGTLNQATIDSIDDVLSEVVRKQAKIIVYLGNSKLTPQIAKVGYEKELHGSEYCWLGSMWVTDTLQDLIKSKYSADESKIYKVLNGAFGLTFRGIQGDWGAEFNQSYFKAYGKSYSNEAMLSYDTGYLFGYTIKKMLADGKDFNSGKELNDALRSADITGASGKVKFSEGTNDRSAYGYSVVNIQDKVPIAVQEYDPLEPSLFKSISGTTIIYGDGSSSVPSDSWPTAYDCPFAQHMSRISINGVIIVFCIGFLLFLITLLLSFFSYRKWRGVTIETIETKTVRNWKDTMAQIQIFIEFFQFIAIAPTFQSLKIVITAASNIFMLDIMKVAQSSKSDYWVLLSVVCALCYAWSFLVVLIMANAENWLKRLPLCQRLLSMMNALFLPFFGNTMFLPSLALLLDVVVCDHYAQGHAYVWRDCYMNCWEGEHVSYLIMAIIAIICYEPIAVFSRPLWQQAKTGLNIKIKPFFLLFKTCIQILLIAVGKSLQGISPVSHGIVFSIIFITFTVLTYKIRPFNYRRCNLWETTSLIAVSYLSVLATLSYAGDPTNIGWFITLILGWAIMVGVAFYIQRKFMPNLLVSPSDKDPKIQNYNVVKPFNEIDVSQDVSDIREMGEIKMGKVEIEKAVRDNIKYDVVSIKKDNEENLRKNSENNEEDEENENEIDGDEVAHPVN